MVSMSESMGSFHVCTFFDSHSSSQLDPDFITRYIASEQIVGHYSDAFLPEDLEKLIGPFHTSPLGLVPKPHSDTFQMIQDMSYPCHPCDLICQCWCEFRWFSHSLELIWPDSILNSCTSARLPSCHIRHLSGLLHQPYPLQPTATPLHVLEGSCLCRLSSNVQADIQCRCVRHNWRHASHNLQRGWFCPSPQMGRWFLCHLPPRSGLDGTGLHKSNQLFWCSLEHQEDKTSSHNPEIHQLQLGPQHPLSVLSSQKTFQKPPTHQRLAQTQQDFPQTRGSQPAGEAHSHVLHFPIDPFLLMQHCLLCRQLLITLGEALCSPTPICQPFLGVLYCPESPEQDAPSPFSSGKPGLVGWCQHFLQHWNHLRPPLGDLEVGSWFLSWPLKGSQHWLGWSCHSRAGALHCGKPVLPIFQSSWWSHLSGLLRLCWNSLHYKQRLFLQPGNEQNTQTRLPATGSAPNLAESSACHKLEQYLRCSLPWHSIQIPGQLPSSQLPSLHFATGPPSREVNIIVAPIFTSFPTTQGSHQLLPTGGLLQLNDSPFQPHCHAEEYIFSLEGN